MSRKLKLLAGVLAAAAVLAVGFTSVAFADSGQVPGDTGNTYGEGCCQAQCKHLCRGTDEAPCAGTGEMHQWGLQDGNGNTYGEPGLGTGPGEMHQWGPQDGNGNSYGESGLGTGPGDMHQWGRGLR